MLRRALCLWVALLLLLPCIALAQAPEGADSIEEAVGQFLQAEFERLAEMESDGWKRYIFRQGIGEVSMKLDKFNAAAGKALSVSFTLSDGTAVLKSLPKYIANPEEWLAALTDDMAQHRAKAKINLLITESGGLYTATYANKAEASLQKNVKALATKAKKAFSGKAVLTALTDYLIPSPIIVPKNAPSSLEPGSFQPVFNDYITRNGIDVAYSITLPVLIYGISGVKLDASGGPEALKLTYKISDAPGLFARCAKDVWPSFQYHPNVHELTDGQLAQMLGARIISAVSPFRHKNSTQERASYTFSLLELPTDLTAGAFYTDLPDPDGVFYEHIAELRKKIEQLPQKTEAAEE